jgi:hypothetical protein
MVKAAGEVNSASLRRNACVRQISVPDPGFILCAIDISDHTAKLNPGTMTNLSHWLIVVGNFAGQGTRSGDAWL